MTSAKAQPKGRIGPVQVVPAQWLPDLCGRLAVDSVKENYSGYM